MNSDGPRWTQMDPDEPIWTRMNPWWIFFLFDFSTIQREMNTFEKKNIFRVDFFFEKNSKFFSEYFLQKCSVHAKTPRNRINRILIKGSFGFIRVHRGPSGSIRVHPLSCGLIRYHAGFKRIHADSCGLMRYHAGWCQPLNGDLSKVIQQKKPP